MKCLVTGAAGFIGSHLCERLITLGHQVIGIDCFTNFYSRSYKEQNIRQLKQMTNFRFIEADLLALNLENLLDGVDYLFHQAAQAGVRPSWGKSFEIYTQLNILTTQKLLETAKNSNLKRLVYASSSSVYGAVEQMPMREDCALHPLSPYGVTKLAAEQLCYLYWRNFGVPVVSLRYFTVYGPRQRPDMAFHKFISAVLSGRPIAIYGDGEQTRDFTFISDAVEANILCLNNGSAGEVYNIGGGTRITINKVLDMLCELTGMPVNPEYQAVQKGDMQHTYADVSKAQRELGFSSEIGIEEGLKREIDWLRNFGI
jgi:nucleoside-diphosphate-sugar epimerase